MRKWFLPAILAIVLALPVYAQRGMGGRGIGATHGVGGFRSAGRGFVGHPARLGGFRHGGFHGGVFFNRFPHSNFRFRSGFRSFYPGVYYWAFPTYDTYADYSAFNSEPSANPYGPYNSGNDQQLSLQIQHLSDEIERLHDQQESLRAASDARASNQQVRRQNAEPTQPATPTKLVFKDQHTEDVENYAIIGQTLWILDEQTARKVPIENLDIAATKSTNENHGVDFEIPE